MSKKNVLFIILSAAAVIFIAALFFKTSVIMSAIHKIASVLSPIVIGMAVAFVLNSPLCKLRALMTKIIKKRRMKTSEKTVNILSVIIIYAVLALILIGIFSLIIPNLIKSISNLISNFGEYYENFLIFYNKLRVKDNLGIITRLGSVLDNFTAITPDWLRRTLNRTTGIIGGLFNAFIGLIVSVYILAEKDNMKRSISEFLSVTIPKRNFDILSKYYRLIFTTFTKFVNGQLAEALILGSLCYVGMVVFGFDYPLLISTIILLTALIPIAGALIGTIPSAFLLLLVEPMEAVWFLLFIIILQQIENNFIYPRVVGNTLGLPAILVFTSILLGAGIAGVLGALLAVPLTAVLYAIINEYIADKKAIKIHAGENI
ncbi:MAG: AI-2E family transporter [Ruminococcus sp.]|jgi:predicted PurR-regulated permease PerM|nr:AI-2E family transporter [Ruminococcus sp.]